MIKTPASRENPVTKEKPPTKKGRLMSQFFEVSLSGLQHVAAVTKSAEAMAAYITLSAGVDGNLKKTAARACTHGALSIQQRTGIGRNSPAMKRAILDLIDCGVLREPESPDLTDSSEVVVKVPPISSDVPQIRYFVDDKRTDWIRIAMAFTMSSDERDEVDLLHMKQATLYGILNDVRGGFVGPQDFRIRISKGRTTCDALLVYVAMMACQEWREFGSVEPTVVSGRFRATSDDVGTICGGRDWFYVSALEPSSLRVSDEFCRFALGGTVEDEANAVLKSRLRVEHAINELRRLHLLYPVDVLWDSDPLDPVDGKDARVITTLYVHDDWLKTHRQAQHRVDEILRKTDTVLGSDEFEVIDASTRATLSRHVNSGQYRYIASKDELDCITLLRQFRVRWLPLDEHGVSQIKQDLIRTNEYIEMLENELFGQ